MVLLLGGACGLAGAVALFPGVSTLWAPFESLATDANPPVIRSIPNTEAPAPPLITSAPPATTPSPEIAPTPPMAADVVQPAVHAPAPRTAAVRTTAAPARPMPVHLLEVPCDARESAIARATCHDPQLWGLNRQMDDAFSEAMQTSVSPRELAAEQKSWIARRDRMAQDDPDRLERLYRDRLRELWTPHQFAPAAQASASEDQFETPSD
jgi:hypothetical protein